MIGGIVSEEILIRKHQSLTRKVVSPTSFKVVTNRSSLGFAESIVSGQYRAPCSAPGAHRSIQLAAAPCGRC